MNSQSDCLGQSKVSVLCLGCSLFSLSISHYIECIFNSFTECKEMQAGVCKASVASSYQRWSVTHAQLPVVFHTEQSKCIFKLLPVEKMVFICNTYA